MTEFSSLRQKSGLSVPEAAAKLGYTEREAYRWERGEVKPRRAILDLLRALKPHCEDRSTPPAFSFIDLFAGIGGLRRGFEAIGGECVFTCEWDRYSRETYSANFPNDGHSIAGDIREVKEADVPEHDVLLAGFPCQPFSIAGVSKKNALNRPHGFACEAQGTLFFEAARIIRHHRPKAFVLENVKNLVNHDRGRTFRVIHDVLTEELGYHVDYRVIDAKAFLPQHRERIFIVGFADEPDFSFETLTLPDPLKGPRLQTILHPGDGTEKPDKHYTTGKDCKVSDKYTLSVHLWTYLQNYAEKHRLAGNGFGFGLFGPDDVARTLSARYYKDGSEILIRQAHKPPRRLTPRECARLMGFDAPGQNDFLIPVSDTQAYKQFGNSVAVPAVTAVARHMEPYIRKAVEQHVQRNEQAPKRQRARG
ncbi:DNA (cytosine-5-)-methyltransferase [Methylocella silvestris]|uniref:Cytosine-specific methyltransferase n=1 Tax=Methylocella silvestris TaxID=199596 RepID=A0A2J7TLK4_METSI|nr:DNA (cytosine-5-)-methyltransferase [Methylocella silvestris]PNG27653.1 DNA (cytosine-5-)-methyltransferase [Methylocella silvestris]